MDFLRHGYRTRFKLWNDDTITDAVWYRVADDTPLFEGLTPFRAYQWTYDEIWNQTNTGLGEQRPYDPDPCVEQYPWYRGMPPFDVVPLHPCGARITWEDGGIRGKTPEIIVDADGRCPDCAEVDQVGSGGEADGAGYTPASSDHGIFVPESFIGSRPYTTPYSCRAGDTAILYTGSVEGFPVPVPLGDWIKLTSYTDSAPSLSAWWLEVPTDGPLTISFSGGGGEGLACGVVLGGSFGPRAAPWLTGHSAAPELASYPVRAPTYGLLLAGSISDFYDLLQPFPGMQGGINSPPTYLLQVDEQEALFLAETGVRTKPVLVPFPGNWTGLPVLVPYGVTAWQGTGGVQIGDGGEADAGDSSQIGGGGQLGSGGEAEAGSALYPDQAGDGGEADGGDGDQGLGVSQRGSGGEADGGDGEQLASYGQVGSGGEADGGDGEQLASYGQVGSGGEADGGDGEQGSGWAGPLVSGSNAHDNQTGSYTQSYATGLPGPAWIVTLMTTETVAPPSPSPSTGWTQLVSQPTGDPLQPGWLAVWIGDPTVQGSPVTWTTNDPTAGFAVVEVTLYQVVGINVNSGQQSNNTTPASAPSLYVVADGQILFGIYGTVPLSGLGTVWPSTFATTATVTGAVQVWVFAATGVTAGATGALDATGPSGDYWASGSITFD